MRMGTIGALALARQNETPAMSAQGPMFERGAMRHRMRRAVVNSVAGLVAACALAACASSPAAEEASTRSPTATPAPTSTLAGAAPISPLPTRPPPDAYAAAYAESIERGDPEEWARSYATGYQFSMEQLRPGAVEDSRRYASLYAYAPEWFDYSDEQAHRYAGAYLVADASPYRAAWGDVYAQVEAHAAARSLAYRPDRRGDEEVFADAYAYAVEQGYSEANANVYASRYVAQNNCECDLAEWAHEYAAASVGAADADIESEYSWLYVDGVMHGVATIMMGKITSSAYTDAYYGALDEADIDSEYFLLYGDGVEWMARMALDAYAKTYAEAAMQGLYSPGQAHDLAEAYAIAYLEVQSELAQTDDPDDDWLVDAYVRERGLGYLPEAKGISLFAYLFAYSGAIARGANPEDASDDAIIYASAYADAVRRGFSRERARNDTNAFVAAREAALSRGKPRSSPRSYAEGYVRGINWPEETGFERSHAFAHAYAEGYADGYSGALARQE